MTHNRRAQVAIIGSSEATQDMVELAERAGAVIARISTLR